MLLQDQSLKEAVQSSPSFSLCGVCMFSTWLQVLWFPVCVLDHGTDSGSVLLPVNMYTFIQSKLVTACFIITPHHSRRSRHGKLDHQQPAHLSLHVHLHMCIKCVVTFDIRDSSCCVYIEGKLNPVMWQLPRCNWVFLNRHTAANRKQKLVPSSDSCRPTETSLESENSREVLAKFCLNGERWRAACQEEAIEHLWICVTQLSGHLLAPPLPLCLSLHFHISFVKKLHVKAQPTFLLLQKNHLDGVQTAARKAEQPCASEASLCAIKVEETSVCIYKPCKYHRDHIRSFLWTSEQQMMDLSCAASLQRRL